MYRDLIKVQGQMQFTEVLSSNIAADTKSKTFIIRQHTSYWISIHDHLIHTAHILHYIPIFLSHPNFMPVELAVTDPAPGNESEVFD